MKKLVYQTPQVLDLFGPGASGQSPLGPCVDGTVPLAPGNPCGAGLFAGEECNAGWDPGIWPPEYCVGGGAPETAPCYVGSFPSGCTSGGAPGIGSCAAGPSAS